MPVSSPRRSQSPSLNELVKDVFGDHDPLHVDCMSVYDPIVAELFICWSYSDSIGELEVNVRNCLENHSNRTVIVTGQLVADIYRLRDKVLESVW